MLVTFFAGLFGRQLSHRFLPSPCANLESTMARMQDSRIKNASNDFSRGRGCEGASRPVGARVAACDVRCRLIPAEHAAVSRVSAGKARAGPTKTATCQGVMPLHQSAKVGCDAAPLVFNVVLARTIPRRPRAPGSALLKAETPKRTPAWGFYFSIRAASIAAGPAPTPLKAVSTFRARSSARRYTPRSGHPVASQRTPLWATNCLVHRSK